MPTKEELRQLRKDAYRKAKELREADPRYQEMKAKLKEKQREIRKAAYACAKAVGKAKKEAIRAEKRGHFELLFVPRQQSLTGLLLLLPHQKVKYIL